MGENHEKTSPRKLVLTEDRIPARSVTGAQATSCSTANRIINDTVLGCNIRIEYVNKLGLFNSVKGEGSLGFLDLRSGQKP